MLVCSICSLVVHLVCQSTVGSYKLVKLLIDGASFDSSVKLKKLDPAVRKVFIKILVCSSF